MGKEINEGGARHPAMPGQSHSLLIYWTKGEKPMHLAVAGCFLCAANPAGLGFIPLRTPCPMHAICMPYIRPIHPPTCPCEKHPP